ncbi:hypothetical protein Tco_0347425 [Tanacetum coccineum]
MASFRLLHSFLQVISYNELKITRGFERAFAAFFDEDVQTFTCSMLLNLDQLEKQLDKEAFQETGSMDAFRSKEGKVDLSKALDADLVVTESNEIESEKHDTSSRSGNDTHVEDADIKPANDKEPMAEVQLTTQHNVLAYEQQHSMQSEPIYDTHLLEKVDSNTTLDSTNMCYRGGEIDKNAEKCQVLCPLLDPSSDNMTTEFSNQSHKSENISLKILFVRIDKTYAKIPKLYRAYELHDENEQLHVFDSEDTLEDAEKSQLKMNEFQKDQKVQELKIQPIDYGKLNKLYNNFVPQKELSAKQTYFSSSCISFVSKKSFEDFSSNTKPCMESMPSANPMLVDLNEMKNIFQTLFELIRKSCKRDVKEMNSIVQKLYFYFTLFQNRFKKDVKEIKDVFVSVENDLDETFKQNKLLKDRLLEASLAEDIKNFIITSCVEIRNKDLNDEIDRISKESKDVSNESKTADISLN